MLMMTLLIDGFTTLTSREEIEYHIMDQNRRQSLQSLCTPFMQIEELRLSIDDFSMSRSSALLDGSFLTDQLDQSGLTINEWAWIESLTTIVDSEISLHLDIEDKKNQKETGKNLIIPIRQTHGTL
jgi:hypothetical protein